MLIEGGAVQGSEIADGTGNQCRNCGTRAGVGAIPLASRVHVGVGGQQQLGDFKVLMIGGPVQGATLVQVACVRAACVCNQMVPHGSDGTAFSCCKNIVLACNAGSCSSLQASKGCGCEQQHNQAAQPKPQLLLAIAPACQPLFAAQCVSETTAKT